MANFVSRWTGLSGGKLSAIEKMTTNQLEDEKIRLQTVQDGFIKQVHDLEGKKRALFEEGRKKKSVIEKQALAVQIKQVDDEARDVIKASNIVSRQILVTGKLSQIKRREKPLKPRGLWGVLGSRQPG